MSDALKRLDAIESRLAAATHQHEHSPGWGCKGCHAVLGSQRELEHHAPADLALLVRLVRSVAEAECDNRDTEIGVESCEDLFGQPADEHECWPCRIRRALEAGR